MVQMFQAVQTSGRSSTPVDMPGIKVVSPPGKISADKPGIASYVNTTVKVTIPSLRGPVPASIAAAYHSSGDVVSFPVKIARIKSRALEPTRARLVAGKVEAYQPDLGVWVIVPGATIKTGKSPALAPLAEASRAIAAQSADAARRIAWLDKMKTARPWVGSFVVPGDKPETVQVRGGVCSFGGVLYQVSKDGRAVINRSNVIVGEIVAGVLRAPSAAFRSEMKQYGEVF